MELTDVAGMVAGGESETLEFKKSTAQLPRAAETLCAFLNAGGGTVLIGVTPEGALTGQQVADSTLQDIANTLRRFESPAPVEIKRINVPNTDRQIIALQAVPSGDSLPFIYDGRPYQWTGSTTSIMPQERYQQLLLNRIHSRQRWENLPTS